MTTGSDLYRRQIATTDDALMRQVWDGTPWMVDAYTGPVSNSGRYREMMDWCLEQFGPQAWPFSDNPNPGNWHMGGVTWFGYTWIGFKTEEMMTRFLNRWPTEETEHE